jgi:hypothetical protein
MHRLWILFLFAFAAVGCRTELRFDATSAADVRQRTHELHGEPATVRASKAFDGSTSEGVIGVDELAKRCTQGPCPLDDLDLRWDVLRSHRVVDTTTVAGIAIAAGLAGGLVYGNYECFGPGCGGTAKTAVIVSDVVVGLGAAIVLAGLHTLTHMHAD